MQRSRIGEAGAIPASTANGTNAEWETFHTMRSLGLLAVLATALAVLPGAFGDEAGDKSVKALLKVVRKDRGDEEWIAAVHEIRQRGEDAVGLLERELQKLEKRHRLALAKVVKEIDALAGPEEETSSETASREAWEQASRAARDYIFDREAFPDAKPGTFVSPGWEEAVRLGSAAVRAFDEIERGIEPDLRYFLKLTAEESKELREKHAKLAEAHERVLDELGRESESPTMRFDSRLFLKLAEGDFGAAAKLYRALPPGRSRLLAWYGYCRTVMRRNGKVEKLLSRTAKRGLARIDHYRMALGHCPFSLSEPLVRAAAGHSREMRDLGYFSHDSPDPDRRTEGDRARLEGYRAAVWENIYAHSSMLEAIPVWEKSAKHHRIMVNPSLTEAGAGDEGPCVLLAGDGDPGSPPGLLYRRVR